MIAFKPGPLSRKAFGERASGFFPEMPKRTRVCFYAPVESRRAPTCICERLEQSAIAARSVAVQVEHPLLVLQRSLIVFERGVHVYMIAAGANVNDPGTALPSSTVPRITAK